MASSSTIFNLSSNSFYLTDSRYLSFKSVFNSRSSIRVPSIQARAIITRRKSAIFALQSNFFRVAQTVYKVAKDGIDAGTNLVPDSIPRPIARISVTVAAVAVSLFVLSSFLSTVFFALGVMGFVYFMYLALNKDKGPKVDRAPESTDEAIEEARKIMDKYK